MHQAPPLPPAIRCGRQSHRQPPIVPRDQQPPVADRPVPLTLGIAFGECPVSSKHHGPVIVAHAVVLEPPINQELHPAWRLTLASPTPTCPTCSAAIRTAWRQPSQILLPEAIAAPSVASTVSPAPHTSRTWTGIAGTRRTACPSDHQRPRSPVVTTTWHPCRIARRRAIMAGGSPTWHPRASAASIRFAS